MKTQNPLIGRSRKSYGDATFYTLNGQNIVRTKPMVVSNPNTPAQEAQRMRFKAFTEAANSLSEENLNLLFATKEVGRNRRSMLQAQLAPAYGTQAATDPDAPSRFETTFQLSKIDQIGSGATGYIGGFITAQISSGQVTVSAANLAVLKANMQLKGDETHVLLVGIAEDGCLIKVATAITMSQLDAAIEGQTSINFEGLSEMEAHGNVCNCYAIGGKLQLIGLGTMVVAERPAKRSAKTNHNVPV